MKTERYRVYFEDEAPTIGAGWRPVEAQVGWKWVKVKTPGAERGKKIPRAIWDKLRKEIRQPTRSAVNGEQHEPRENR